MVETEPHNDNDVLLSNNWRRAMQEQYNSLMKNRTWKLVPLKSRRKVIGNKWLYRLKCDSEGKVQGYKARLVAKNFLQTPEMDFSETFSPIIKASTLKIILTLTVSRDWQIKWADIMHS